MKTEEQIHFLSDLLKVIDTLQTLVRDYCRVITDDQDGSCLESDPGHHNDPF